MIEKQVVNYLLFVICGSLLVTTFAPDFENELFNLNKNSRRNEIYQVTYYHRITFAKVTLRGILA